jgi:UDP-glucuronate 4-epimerase
MATWNSNDIGFTKVTSQNSNGECVTILVTGGAGFIGSHLVERLLGLGHHVITFDNFDDFYSPSLKRSNIAEAAKHPHNTVIEGDIRDREVLSRCFRDAAIDTVIHLAARAGVRPSIANPRVYYDVNVMGTLTLLDVMHNANVRRLIFASSSSVYGNSPNVPFSEASSVDTPISPYAASKKAGELVCHTYHHLHNFDVFCLRFFTAYGPRQRPDMAIHQFVRKISNGEQITLYGDGSSMRDYTYVEDIVDGILQAVRRVRGYEIINLGESGTIGLKDLVELLQTQLGKKANIEWLPAQQGDVDRTCADISKAKRILGYAPRYSIEEGIRHFCEWYYDQERP